MVGAGDAYLVRKGEGELDLVRGDLGVTATLDGAGDGGGPRAEGGTGETEGAHDGWRGGEDAIAGLPEAGVVVNLCRPKSALGVARQKRLSALRHGCNHGISCNRW
jgi:hypothetical protein